MVITLEMQQWMIRSQVLTPVPLLLASEGGLTRGTDAVQRLDGGGSVADQAPAVLARGAYTGIR
jgi:hypothetical protein